MTNFISGISSLFGGESAATKEAAKAREAQSITLSKQTQDQQVAEAEQDQQLGRASRIPRGRRLLLAATGEQGVSAKLGG